MTRNACDSHDGPNRKVPVEMMPVAITKAKSPEFRSLMAVAARPTDRGWPRLAPVPIGPTIPCHGPLVSAHGSGRAVLPIELDPRHDHGTTTIQGRGCNSC